MFILNGNRRPAPSFVVNLSRKKGKYVKPSLQQRIIDSGISQLNRIYGEVTEREIVSAFSSLDMKVSVNIVQANIEKLDKVHNHILYNVVQNKRTMKHGQDNPDFGSVAYIYVIPKANIVGNPIQRSNSFVAKMQADCIVESREDMKMTKIFKFPRRQRGDIFVKSKAEADYFSKQHDNAPYETVEALRLSSDHCVKDGAVVAKPENKQPQKTGYDYFVDDKKIKISTIRTDLHTIRCFDSEAVAKEAFGQVFKVSFTGGSFSYYTNANVKSLQPGLYRCVNKKEGYLFIEIHESAVLGKVRMVHFLDEKHEKTSEMLLKYPVLTAWENPIY